MRCSFPAGTTSNPLPPCPAAFTETETRLHCLPSCSKVHCFNDLRVLMLLCLCKCVKVQALPGLRLLCAPFASTHSLYHYLIPVTLHLYLARFSPYPSNLFHPFLLFDVASLFASDRFASVGNQANSNKRKKAQHEIHQSRRSMGCPNSGSNLSWQG